MSAEGGPGSVGGFRAREEAEKAEKERQQQAEASRRAQQSEAGKEAHRQAVLEAYKRGKEQDGTQRTTVRTDYSADTASTTIKEKSGGRSERREQKQFSQSGAPVNLQGDKQAIQQVRAEAFQRARQKGTVSEAAVNRETRNILAERGGSVSVVDRAAQKQAINEAYADFKRDKSIPTSDMAIMTPVRGIRSRSVYEGFREDGGRDVAVIGPPKVEKVTLGMETPPDDPARGLINAFTDTGKLYFAGIEGAFDPVGAAKRQVRPSTRLELERNTEAEVFGAVGTGKQDLTLGGVPVGGSVLFTEQTFKNLSSAGKSFGEAPLYFTGSAVGSVALWLSPAAAARLSRAFTGVGSVGRASAAKPSQSAFAPRVFKVDTARPDVVTKNFIPELEQPPTVAASFKPATTAKRVTTLADIDKRLGIGVKDKGDFSEVRTRTGQVLLVKKPIQVQKPVMILSNPLQIVESLFKQSTKTKSRQSMVFKPSEMFKPIQERQTRQVFDTKTTQRQMTSQELARTIGFRQASRQRTGLNRQLAQATVFKQTSAQQQSFASMFKQSTKQSQLFKFNQATQQSQQFRFNFSTIQRQLTRTTTPRRTTRVPPPFTLGLGVQTFKVGKKGKKSKAAPREGNIRDLISVSLGQDNPIAKSFRRRYGRRF